MTRNQIDALKLQESKRHNQQQELIDKWSLPAQYMQGIGSITRGLGSLKPNAMKSSGTHWVRSGKYFI